MEHKYCWIYKSIHEQVGCGRPGLMGWDIELVDLVRVVVVNADAKYFNLFQWPNRDPELANSLIEDLSNSCAHSIRHCSSTRMQQCVRHSTSLSRTNPQEDRMSTRLNSRH